MSNYKFKTTNIRGKQYVEVNERIKFFRQEEQYKGWSISTSVVHMNNDEVVMCTSILDTNGNVIATGHAHEVKGSSTINKTSHIENCETSAVGRALAMLGIGIDTSIASANEVETAIAKQESDEQQIVTTPVPPVENIMDKAVEYLKSAKDKKRAYNATIKKYGEQLTENQKAGLQKFVR
jgi:CO dehydrogenase/acetyl-CoA synthase gamma subunit (corrinoid Fe-S protein)